MAIKTDLKVHILGLQEMKAYRCSKCHFNPSWKIAYNDANGIRRVEYFCKNHYRDFLSTENKQLMHTGCDWCGVVDDHYRQVEKLGESTGKLYKVCTPCFDRQEIELTKQFAEDDLGDEEDPLDLYRGFEDED